MIKPTTHTVNAFLVACLLVQGVSCFKKTSINSNLVGPPPPVEFSEEGFKRTKTLITMNRSYLNKRANLHDDLQTGARFDRKTEGLRIGRIKEDSIYMKFGFWDGDIILDKKENFSEELETKLKNDSLVVIKIKRNNVEETVQIHID